MRRVVLHEEVEAELRDAAQYYEAHRPGYGSVFERAFFATGETIATRPLTGRRIAGGLRKLPVAGFPYNAIYLADADPIIIVALAHHRRQPFYWSSRLQ